MNTSTALLDRRPQSRITLAKSLELFEAAYRARNLSPKTVKWYRERLQPFFAHLETQVEREPNIADLTIPVFRLFVLEKQSTPKYREHRFRRETEELPSPAHIHGFFRAVRGFSSWLF